MHQPIYTNDSNLIALCRSGEGEIEKWRTIFHVLCGPGCNDFIMNVNEVSSEVFPHNKMFKPACSLLVSVAASGCD